MLGALELSLDPKRDAVRSRPARYTLSSLSQGWVPLRFHFRGEPLGFMIPDGWRKSTDDAVDGGWAA